MGSFKLLDRRGPWSGERITLMLASSCCSCLSIGAVVSGHWRYGIRGLALGVFGLAAYIVRRAPPVRPAAR